MEKRIGLGLMLLCVGVSALGDSPWPTSLQWGAEAEQFARNRIDDARILVFGPSLPAITSPVPKNASCDALYEARVRLLKAQDNYNPTFGSDPRNEAAAIASTMASGTLAFLAFSAARSYTEAGHDQETEARIDALRSASAQQLCYVR